MIRLLPEMPAHVVAASASGQVTGEDYETILVPAIEKALQKHEKIRLLYQLGPEFRKFTTTALWDDAKVGFHHLTDFDRVAVVTDYIQTCNPCFCNLADSPGHLVNPTVEQAIDGERCVHLDRQHH